MPRVVCPKCGGKLYVERSADAMFRSPVAKSSGRIGKEFLAIERSIASRLRCDDCHTFFEFEVREERIVPDTIEEQEQ